MNSINDKLNNHDTIRPQSDLHRVIKADRFHRVIKADRFSVYVLNTDTQRTITRRESSLINQTSYSKDNITGFTAPQKPLSSGRLYYANNDSSISLLQRPKGSIQKELVTKLFETMLDGIVESWQVIPVKKPEEVLSENGEKIDQQMSQNKLKRKSQLSTGKLKGRASRSRLELNPSDFTPEPIQRVWWSGPDERVVIKFKNGNIYEGGISMKCMNGEGRFQWNDGTIYFGQFKDNEICGQGRLQWKDDTWYEGEFAGNIRNGHGLYVDSRKQRSYAGEWQCGAKHGKGIMYYSKDIFDTYDGEWVKNVRHGFGAREYCKMSGYKGAWDNYIRDGKGLMIWPNHDFYRGDWKNGVMSGQGIYIWNATINFSLSTPSFTAYRGKWFKGERHGYGHLNLGTGMGSHYKGEYKNNKKHGAGKLVTNNGLTLKNRHLFYEDNLGALDDESYSDTVRRFQSEPYQFHMYNDLIGLLYHVQQAYLNLDRQEELRLQIIREYIKNNKSSSFQTLKANSLYEIGEDSIDNFLAFEEESLHKALKCYEPTLRDIYYNYATICNEKEIKFTPVLIRLYLWQLYFDCQMHHKGLTLVDIDKLLYSNPDWLIDEPHNPFERIYFWQFVHSLISVARKLYAIRELPGPKPETIVASALRTFMDNDILPNIDKHKGHLVNGHARYVPLQGLYKLYKDLGEPHTVRTFLCAILKPPHCVDSPQLEVLDMSLDSLVQGQNAYVVGDVMAYVVGDFTPEKDAVKVEMVRHIQDMKLFHFANLSSSYILGIFANIFPGLAEGGKYVDLEVKMTFFEFFEAFITCGIESIKISEEDIGLHRPSDIMTVPFTSPAETPRK